MDIWAAGVTLYYMVEFNPPFQGSTLAELYSNIGKGEFRCASEQAWGFGKMGKISVCSSRRRVHVWANPHQDFFVREK